ncbi:YSIRK-type signal peptide-containing protein [Lactobacillus sp. PV037]|uniref:YSIRK-type signal peptide-containing protein n=1 Tax=Lactobacillus sp. PV037 TaxID=2594496 RepID=UPI00223ED10C|nr:YSIRK-type signal peptide-containing protein [Lactobacillus sp. PV037]QNQ83549.1 YSIRK-type signal peptide-containing protein [Lactobacillus sp. PV037]
MLSKNNFREKLRKMEPKKQIFSIRTLKVGVSSVLIGLAFMGSGRVAKAAEVSPAQSTTVTTQSSQDATKDNKTEVDDNVAKQTGDTQNQKNSEARVTTNSENSKEGSKEQTLDKKAAPQASASSKDASANGDATNKVKIGGGRTAFYKPF